MRGDVAWTSQAAIRAALAYLAALGLSGCGSTSSGHLDAAPDGRGSSTPRQGTLCYEEGALVCGQSVDGKTDDLVLNCTGGLYQTVFQCPPSQACVNIVGHDQVRCGGDASGTYFAKEGVACLNEAGQACSFDQQVVLRCSQGTWSTAIHCAPSSCGYQTSGDCTGTWCANCGYTPGDRCSFGGDAVRCSTDLSKILECTNGAATVWRDCGTRQCTTVTIDGRPVLDC